MMPVPAADVVQLGLGTTGLLVLIGVCLALSFVFSGTETALFSLQKVDRQRFANNGRTGRRVVWFLSRRSALITTILMGNETANVLLASSGAELFAGNRWMNVLVITPVLVLLSEITPKVLAFRFNTVWARAISWPLYAFYLLVSLPRVLVSSVVMGLARVFRVSARAQTDGLQEAELLDLLDQSAHVDEREREIVEAVFEFDDLSVARLMTPRPDIFALPLDTPWDEVLSQCRQHEYSRVPVYDRGLDDIVGVLLLKDLLRHRARPPAGPRQLRSILLPPVFVPQSKPAEDMLGEFLGSKSHLSLVVDEHGTLVGLVTLDDLLAELFGAIPDDGDEGTDEAPAIEETRPGVLTVQANLDLEDFAEETGVELPNGEYHTLAGFVFHELGRLPRRGDVVEWNDHRFRVRTMDGRRIVEVQVELPAPADEVAS